MHSSVASWQSCAETHFCWVRFVLAVYSQWAREACSKEQLAMILNALEAKFRYCLSLPLTLL